MKTVIMPRNMEGEIELIGRYIPLKLSDEDKQKDIKLIKEYNPYLTLNIFHKASCEPEEYVPKGGRNRSFIVVPKGLRGLFFPVIYYMYPEHFSEAQIRNQVSALINFNPDFTVEFMLHGEFVHTNITAIHRKMSWNFSAN